MDLHMSGKVALVTGASSGIGWATCESLAAEGVLVVGVSRREVTAVLAGVSHLRLDLAQPKAPAAAVEAAIERHGRLDILVNNVGMGGLHASFADITDDEWASRLNLNLMTAVRTIRSAVPHLIETRGAIANISSVNGRAPFPQIADYSASKAALNSLGKSVAKAYAPQGVRVVTVSPGPVSTPMWMGDEGAGAQLAAMTGGDKESVIRAAEAARPIGRFSTPEEIADAVTFLVSSRSGSTTGIELIVDGGATPTL